jgi:hypothetical protein
MHTSFNIKFASYISKPYAPIYMQVVKRCKDKSKTLNHGTLNPNAKTLNLGIQNP